MDQFTVFGFISFIYGTWGTFHLIKVAFDGVNDSLHGTVTFVKISILFFLENVTSLFLYFYILHELLFILGNALVIDAPRI